MAFTRGLLFRKDLLSAMDKRKPRLRVALTDCCANYIDGGFPNAPGPGGGERRLPGGAGLHSWPHLDPFVLKAPQDRRPPAEEPPGNPPRLAEPPGQEYPLPSGVRIRSATAKAKNVEPPSILTRGVDIRTATGKI